MVTSTLGERTNPSGGGARSSLSREGISGMLTQIRPSRLNRRLEYSISLSSPREGTWTLNSFDTWRLSSSVGCRRSIHIGRAAAAEDANDLINNCSAVNSATDDAT